MKYIYLCLMAFVLGWTRADAQEIGKILKIIEENNPELKVARERFAAEIAGAESENTIIGATSIEYSPFFHRGVKGLASSELIVSQEFGLPKVYRNRKQAIALQRNTKDFAYRTMRRDVLLEALQLCNELDFAHQSVALIAQRQAATDSILAIFERRLSLGHATIIEVQRIRLDSMQLATEMSLAEKSIHQALGNLKALSGGVGEEVFIEVSNALKMEASHPSLDSPTYDAVLDVDAESLEAQTAEAALAETRHQESVSRKGWLPTFTVGYRRNTDLHVGNGGFLVGVSFPFAANAKKQRAAHLQRSAAEAEVAAARSAENLRQTTLAGEALSLQRTLSTYDVTLMQNSLTTLHHAVMEGEIPVTDYFIQVEKIYSTLQQRLETQKNLVKIISELHREEL